MLMPVRQPEPTAINRQQVLDLLRELGICASGYQLPGSERDKYVIPVSGGADSSAMVVVLTSLFPDTPFTLMFTDTGDESKELYQSLDRLEAFVSRPIVRLGDENRTLFSLIEKFNGFLPSSRDRWCTKNLKLQPFEAFMPSLREADEQVYSFVGVRADEDERVGLVSRSDWIHTEMPFKDLGIGRREVYTILDRTIGIPGFYAFRSRSGCRSCPFQRKSEMVGQLLYDPSNYAEASSKEKIPEADRNRFAEPVVPLTAETGIARNWLGFPVPPQIDCRTAKTAAPTKWGKGKKKGVPTGDLFDDAPVNGLWVAIEFLVDPWVGGSGVYWQEFITYSTTRQGLQMQLQLHYEHRLETAEVRGETPESMRENLRLAMYFIEAPRAVFDTAPLSKGGFTWAQGESYARRKHLVEWAQRVLQFAQMEREQAEHAQAGEMQVEHEWHQAGRAGMARIEKPVGRLVAMGKFTPIHGIKTERTEKTTACFMCSI